MNTTAQTHGRNEIMTYWWARKWLDTRFIQAREDGLATLTRPTAQAVFLRVLNSRWRRAASELRRRLLPQKVRKHYRRAVKTINPKGKARPRDSWLGKRQSRRRRGLTPKRKGRSHHKGKYIPRDPLNPKRGRPRVSDAHRKAKARDYELKRNAARRRETAEHRRRRGLQPFRRFTAAESARREMERRARSLVITAARALVGRKKPGSRRTLKGYWRAVHRIAGRPHVYRRRR